MVLGILCLVLWAGDVQLAAKMANRRQIGDSPSWENHVARLVSVTACKVVKHIAEVSSGYRIKEKDLSNVSNESERSEPDANVTDHD